MYELKENLKTLIPATFQGTLHPISINFIDQEKVIALLKEKTKDFSTAQNQKQQFSIAVKIYPFTNRVVSLHIILLRVEKVAGLTNEEDEESGIVEETKTAEKGKLI